MTSVKMRYQVWILWSLLNLNQKQTLMDIDSSSSDDEEEGVEYKVKQISKSDWCECSAEAVVGRCSSKQVSALQLY